MTKFKFYGRDDDNKESICVLEAVNIEEATKKAANIKDLPLIIFEQLFCVDKF
tara:strand:- start:3484 stop:3642 length:159 start_codon:yes stop_codon:yes gene_type:complete